MLNTETTSNTSNTSNTNNISHTSNTSKTEAVVVPVGGAMFAPSSRFFSTATLPIFFFFFLCGNRQ